MQSFISDYMFIVIVFTAIAAIRFAVLYYTTSFDEYGNVDDGIPGKPKLDPVDQVKANYDLSIRPVQEREVKIKQIWLYPVRGIHGLTVNQCEITPFGLKYDRNWVIIGKRKMKPLACANSSIVTFLKCSMETVDGADYAKVGGEPRKLRIFLQDDKCFPEVKKREHELRFDRDYLGEGAELVKANKKYRGYKESDEVCNWLSEIFGEDVILIRAEPDRVMLPSDYLDKQLADDRRGAFITDAAIHVCNEESLKSLQMSLYNKYRDDEELLGQCNSEARTFRPSFVINEPHEEAYVEEEFQELRIANVMFRQIGPCQRCKTTSLNWVRNERHPKMEPYASLCEVRKQHQYGPVFGIYLQPDVIETKEQFKELLPNFTEPTDRSFGDAAVIKLSDTFKLRVRKRNYYLQ